MNYPQSKGAFRASSFLSSLDIIKLANLYDSNAVCAEFNQTSFYCGTDDNVESGPPVLDSKICDNKPDCPGGEDENGKLAECKARF